MTGGEARAARAVAVRDHGSVTIWAASALALVWLAVTAASAYGGGVLARHRVETAADLAALAAAVQAPLGRSAACAVAAEVVIGNGGVLTDCRLAGEDVEVVVTLPVRASGVRIRSAVARARAGPVDRRVPVP